MGKEKSRDVLLSAAETVESTVPKVRKLTVLSERQRDEVIKELKEATNNLNEVAKNLKVENQKMAEFILKLAKDVKLNSVDKKIERNGVKEYLKMVQKLWKYSRAAKYDFDPDLIKKVKRAYKEYLIGMVMFFILSRMAMIQLFVLVALVLTIPTIIAMVSLQRRGSRGLLLALISIPIPAVEGAIVAIYSISDLMSPVEIQKMASTMGRSYAFAHYYVLALLILGVIEFYLLTDSGRKLYQLRDAFI